MAFNLKKVVRALLFSTGQPLTIRDLQGVFTRFHEAEPDSGPAEPPAEGESPAAGEPVETESRIKEAVDPELYGDVPSLVTASELRGVLEEIATELREADQGLLLVEGASGFRLVTDPRLARWVRILRAEPPPVKLSPSALETLAVVAYRQPVTRSEIEAIRGVSAEAGLNRLLERELIHITGRADQPGRPIQYGTTERFLEFTGLRSIDELPASDVLSHRQLDDWLQQAMNPAELSDSAMGLPEEPTPDASSNGENEPAAREG